MPTVIRRAAVAASLALLVLLAACGGGGDAASDDRPSITARGLGRVTGIPDTVVLVLGVESEDAEAAAALARNSERAQAVIDLLKDAGVPDEDIQTSQFSINPRFDDEGRRITGYVVSNLVTARVGDVGQSGELIDAAARAAGNDVRVQSVSFEIDDDGPLFAEARADAVARARTQAEQLAEAADVDLGRVRSITESSTQQPPIPMPLTRAETFDAAVPLQPGAQEITLEVEVIYDID